MKDKVILLTGAGGGIGFETAKALVYMGAKVIVAEIDKRKMLCAQRTLDSIFSKNSVEFYEIDLSGRCSKHNANYSKKH